MILRYDEVRSLEQISQRTLRRRLASGRYVSTRLAERHENGRPVRGIPASCLSRAARARLEARSDGHRDAPINTLIHTRTREGASADVPITADGLPDVAALRARGQDGIAQEWDRRMRAVARSRVLVNRADHGETCAAWQRVAAEYDISERTLRRWDRALRDYGPVGLVPATGSQRGESRVIPDKLGLQIREAWLQENRWSYQQVWRDIVRPYCREYDLDVPHPSTVRRYIQRHVLPIEEARYRGDLRAWKAYAAPKVRRKLPPINSIWVADHRKFDVFVLDDGRPIRPWITAIIDVGSAGWVGWRICRRPNADAVCHALRSALLSCGIPDAFVRDNGREFAANRLGGRAERRSNPAPDDLAAAERWPAEIPREVEHSGIWQALGIQLITALPYSAWSKPIEPIFGAWSRSYENQIPGWCGRDAQDKPDGLQTDIDRENLLTYEQFLALAGYLIEEEWNNGHVCGERDCTPAEAYADYDARIPDPQTVGYLLRDRRERRVTTSGIEIAGHRYMSTGLAPYVGARVRVAHDPAEPNWITVYTPDDRVLAVPEARSARWLEWGAANTDAKRQERAQRQHLVRVRDEIRGATPLERLDPTGGAHMVAARKRLEAGRAERARLEADAAVQHQIQRRVSTPDRAAETPDDTSAAYRAIEHLL